MLTVILSIMGIVGGFFLIKYRQIIGDTIGEAEWMKYVGGVYNFLILLAILIFFWSVASLTGTSDFLFGWIRYVIPGLRPAEQPEIPTY